MGTRLPILFVGNPLLYTFLLLSVRLGSIKCSVNNMLMPCYDGASGSGEYSGDADVSSSRGFELCPASSTVQASSAIISVIPLLTNTITSEVQPSSSLLTTSFAVESTSTVVLDTPTSTAVLTPTSTASSRSMSSSINSVSQTLETTQVMSTVSPTPTLIQTRSTTDILMTSSPFPSTTGEMMIPTTQSIFDRIRGWFEELSLESRIGLAVGGAVVLLLLAVILCFCCCCVRSRLREKKKGRMDISNHRGSLTISNPIAMVSRSKNLDERIPARYRSTIHDSLDYSTDVDIQDSDFNFLTNDHEYRESAIDDLEMAYISHQPSQVAHTTQPSQMTQLSTATDIFRERSLPKLSPLSYSSQMLTAPPLSNHYHSLSVDETDTRTALGSRRQSLMALIPNPSPSLRVPTLMARSLKNEETKSAQGSKGSVQGSRTSIQGSRASILGSRGSVHTGTGSRSQIYSSNLSSREHSRLGLGVSEEDEVSLPLSGRGISPAMKQSSFEEVPTRDSPRPEIASHTVGFGRKDFASLTCIPNRYAVEVDKFEEKQQLSTVPEKQTVEDVQENEETKKKPRSRAMSKLEKLTSLDYIRASLRLKKKRVSFVRTPELSKKDKQKNTKEKQDQEKKVKGQQQPPSTSTSRPGKELHHSRRHSASGRAEFSPQHLHGEQSLSSHNYPDHFYYPQLSQPVYYGAAGAGAGGTGGVHPAAAAAIFYQYPQLSQQYYAQLSQGGPGPGPYPPHMMYHSMMDSYSRGFGDPTSPARYQQIVTPDLFDDDTPEPEFYQERNLDNVLQQRQEANGFGDSLRSPEHTGPRVTSPDRFTETSETSFYSMHPPHQSSTDAESHSHEDSLTSAHKHFMEEFAMDGVEQYSYGGPPVDGHHYVPTYPGDMLNRTTLIPHEAYRDVYSHGGETYNTHEQINGHYYSHYTSPTAYSAVSQSKVGRRPSRSSYASSTSDHTHLDSVHEAGGGGEGEATKNGDMNGSSQKNRVSWSAEVIEYQRTPSDLADSDFDFSQF